MCSRISLESPVTALVFEPGTLAASDEFGDTTTTDGPPGVVTALAIDVEAAEAVNTIDLVFVELLANCSSMDASGRSIEEDPEAEETDDEGN